MSTLLYIACLSAGLTACVCLALRGISASWPGTGVMWFVSVSTLGDLLTLVHPRLFWTPEACVVREILACVACMAAALQIARLHLPTRLAVWRRGARLIAALSLLLLAIGILGLVTMTDVERSGYRGLVVVYAATAAVVASVLLTISAHGLPMQRLAAAFLQAVLLYLIIQMLYVGMWEYSRDRAVVLGYVSSCTYVAVMLVLAREGLLELAATRAGTGPVPC